MRPTRMSRRPSIAVRSSSVSLPHCSLMWPLATFQLPLIFSQVGLGWLAVVVVEVWADAGLTIAAGATAKVSALSAARARIFRIENSVVGRRGDGAGMRAEPAHCSGETLPGPEGFSGDTPSASREARAKPDCKKRATRGAGSRRGRYAAFIVA